MIRVTMWGALLVAILYAQSTPPQDASTARVYMYRLGAYTGAARRMTLSLDGERFAYLQNGRYWAVKLPAGEHVIADKDPNDYLKFSVEAGRVYYIRGEWATKGALGFNVRFSMVDAPTASGDVRRLKFGDLDQIQNSKVTLVRP
jgi:hypothetical protein